MANILLTRLCREIKTDELTGKHFCVGDSEALAWLNAGVGFVIAVYWLGYIGERFSLSYTLVDEADNILDRPPEMECEFIGEEVNLSTANFYAAFPQAGSYHVNVYQNGICAQTIPVHVIESLGSQEAVA